MAANLKCFRAHIFPMMWSWYNRFLRLFAKHANMHCQIIFGLPYGILYMRWMANLNDLIVKTKLKHKFKIRFSTLFIKSATNFKGFVTVNLFFCSARLFRLGVSHVTFVIRTWCFYLQTDFLIFVQTNSIQNVSSWSHKKMWNVLTSPLDINQITNLCVFFVL